jgi:hypothetical protein
MHTDWECGGEVEVWASRTEEEGCIIVAGSDDSVKFHEVGVGEKSGGKTGQSFGLWEGHSGGAVGSWKGC